MSYHGDFNNDKTFDIKFTTRRFSTGAPFTLGGTPAISIYKDNSTTQLTAGITLTVDFDGVTGLNNLRVVATAANGYTDGSEYQAVITTGTVDGVSVVGEVVASFSILNRVWNFDTIWDALVADHTVAGTFGKVLSSDLDDIQARLPAALVGGRIDASVGAVAAGAIVASSFAVGAIDAAALAAGAVDEIVDAAWDEATSGHTTAGTYGNKLGAHIAAVLKAVIGVGSTTTAVVLSTVDGAAPSATNDFYNGRVLIFTSGTLAGQATDITDYDGASVTLTVTALTGAPASSVTAVIV